MLSVVSYPLNKIYLIQKVTDNIRNNIHRIRFIPILKNWNLSIFSYLTDKCDWKPGRYLTFLSIYIKFYVMASNNSTKRQRATKFSFSKKELLLPVKVCSTKQICIANRFFHSLTYSNGAAHYNLNESSHHIMPENY